MCPARELVRVLRHGGHLIISDLHPEIQAMMGPCHQEIIQGKERFFPAYHPQVDDYLEAVKLTGAEVLSVIEVPMETERGQMPGALIICAENKSRRS